MARSEIVQESLADLGLDGRTCAAGRQHDDVHDSARVGYRRFPLALTRKIAVLTQRKNCIGILFGKVG